MPRILFVKTSSLGDVVHNCPAASDVARRLPDATIDWVVEEAFAEVVRLHPAVARAIPVAIRRWRRTPFLPATWSEIAAFARALRAAPYDCVIDAQGLLKSAFVARLARGPRHGFDRASAREPLAARFYDAVHAVSPALHAVERNRRLAACALGYAADGACDYGLVASGEPPFAPARPYAVLLTMTSRADKLWPEERWRALGQALAARGIVPVLPWGSERERARAERIATALPGAIVPPRLALSALARLIARARCAIGVDTGLTHLAAALGVPTLGLYCGSDPARTGLYGGRRAQNLGAPGAAPEAAEAIAALEALL
ncbi:MAG: lipopolysaccharide heptosyltransferase I [Burkholderiales bacterium]|nr:lipopolysaccharide heptosyltransferase I [Burkholderiales bacterium]